MKYFKSFSIAAGLAVALIGSAHAADVKLMTGPQGGVWVPLGGMVEVRERARRGSVADVGNQRIERRAAFGLIETSDRLGVGGVGAEPVDGLGREGDEAARGEHARGQCGRRATLERTVPGRLRLYHSGCRWRAHRGYLCLRRRGDAVIRAAFWQAECSAVW